MNLSVFEAIQRGDLEGLQETLRLDPGSAASRDANGISALVLAHYAHRTDMVEILLAAGVPIDAFEAAMLGDAERLSALLRSDPTLALAWSPDGFTALQLASFFGHPAAVRALVEAGADVRAVSRNPMQLTALHSAVASRQPTIAALLIQRGANANAIQAGGWTPLHGAAHAGDSELLEMLLGAGADATVRGDDGRDASEMAAERGHQAVAARLRQAADTQ